MLILQLYAVLFFIKEFTTDKTQFMGRGRSWLLRLKKIFKDKPGNILKKNDTGSIFRVFLKQNRFKFYLSFPWILKEKNHLLL